MESRPDVITPSKGLDAFRGEAIINWVGVRGFEHPMASLLLLGLPMGFKQTKAITGIYIWGVFRDDTARPKWLMRGGVLGEEAGPEPALNQLGAPGFYGGGREDRSAEGARIEAPRGVVH